MKKQSAFIPSTGAERRSSRVSFTVPLLITSAGRDAKVITEETATLSINCHGCRYFSRYSTRVGSKVSIQITAQITSQIAGQTEGSSDDATVSSSPYPARVIWKRKSKRLDGFYQIGVEFDAPLNLWQLDQTPEDWQSFSPRQSYTPTSGAEIRVPTADDPVEILAEAERLLELAREGTHYQLLDVQPDTDRTAMKRKFYHLAQRFHPDRNMNHPDWTPRLLVLMDALTTAYKILTDDEAKRQYDSSLVPISDKQAESKELARESLEKARQCLAEQNYVGSILWLRRAIDSEPDTSGYRAMLAQSLASIPEYRREAMGQFEKAIELDPDNITAHIQYGELLEKLKLPARARSHYMFVLELVMDHREARDHLKRLDAGTPRIASRPSLLGRLTGRR